MPEAATIEERGGLEVLVFPALVDAPLDAAITTRAGGVSNGPYARLNLGLHVGDDPERVVSNRERAAAAIGLGLDDLVFARQVHGREVAVVGTADRGRGARSEADALPDVDALVTREPGVGLAVLLADCAPILIVDPVGPALACVHAGWRGAVARIGGAAVEVLVAGGSRREDLRAFIGPAVAADRYQVGSEVADAAADSYGPAADAVLRPDGTGRWTFDVARANELVLADAGLPGGAVVRVPCTTGATGRFFSDRAVRPCGRFGLLARLR